MDVLPTVDLVLVETGKTNAAAIKVAYEAKSVTVKAFATADVTELVGADDPEYVVTPLE
jgi:hypothetical protein